MDSYAVHLFSAAAPRRFSAGDAVFVWLKSNRSTGRAVVQATPAELAAQPTDGSSSDGSSSRFSGRYQVRFSGSSLTAHVRPERLLPVFPQQQRLLLVCYSTDDYRRLCRSQVSERDVVLELGCSYGIATDVLSQHARHVIGVDNSQLVVAKAREAFPHVRFEVADVLQEPAAVLQLIKQSNSSSSSPSDMAQPQPCRAAGDGGSGSDHAADGGGVNVVFVDIGGNRQLEDLVRLLPWVLEKLSPRLVVVKSECLAEAALEQLQQQQQQQQEGPAGEQTVRQQDQPTQQQPAEGQQPPPQQQKQQQHNPCGLPPAATADGRIQQPAAWWRRLEASCHLGTLGNNSGRAEPWWLAAKAAGFTKHPLRFPLRYTEDGTNICRPHNYQICLKGATAGSSGCPFDHRHCHHCGLEGHRAVECPGIV